MRPASASIGRLKPGGSADVAQQELAPVAARIKSEVPQQLWNGHFEVMPFAASFIGDDAKLIWTMLVAVGFVLLIACANVSNLLLARSAYRVRETTVRSALGASRGRLVVHMLAEGLVISALATLVGLLLASIALDAFRIVMERTQDGNPEWWTYEINFRVVVFAVGGSTAVDDDRGAPGGAARLAALARCAACATAGARAPASRSAGSPGASWCSRWRSPACCSAAPR